MKDNLRIMIAAGGTAGHINPALAIAEYFCKKNENTVVTFVGRRSGMEYGLVTRAGYSFSHIEVQGFQRKITPKNLARNVAAVYHLSQSFSAAKKIIEEFRPDIVIGTGGYVSGPVLKTAQQMGIKTALHESNAYPGITNKLLAKNASIVFVAVSDAINRVGVHYKTIVTGNPVRPEIYRQNRQQARAELQVQNRPMLLSFGGSLGARKLNEIVAEFCGWHLKNRDYIHYHATGSYGVELFSKLSKEMGFEKNANLIVSEYIQNMPQVLCAADIVISRAGALTVSEIAAAGRASVLVPSPNVSENHQYYNALQLQNAGGAIIIEEKNFTKEALVAAVEEIINTPNKLLEMGIQAKSCSVPNALEKIYIHIEKLFN